MCNEDKKRLELYLNLNVKVQKAVARFLQIIMFVKPYTSSFILVSQPVTKIITQKILK